MAGDRPAAVGHHRPPGLLETDEGYVIVGGMRADQRVTGEVIRFRLEAAAAAPD